jgi:hypothetical protein
MPQDVDIAITPSKFKEYMLRPVPLVEDLVDRILKPL